MTDDNKKTPTDDKITELSAWQKRNKEYLEKKAFEKAEEAETEETESEEAQEDENLSEKETASVSEEESEEIEESEEENESEGEEDPEADRESSEEEDDPAVEELDLSEKQEKKPSFFKGLKMKKPKKEPAIDGYKGFLFLDKKDMPEVALHWEKHFEWALAKHNRIYKEQLPKITPHVCRHTYCSNMAKSGMNPKTLQYLMGHADIGVTLNTYTHLGAEDAREELGKFAKMA